MRETHICPPFCHRCPRVGGAVKAAPGCRILGGDLTSCQCLGVVCACGRSAESRCSWPVRAMVPIEVRDLRHGDVCSNLNNTRTGKVLEIEADLFPENMRLLQVTIVRAYKHASPYGRGRVDKYQWDYKALVLTKRDGVCGEPACYRHIRDLDGGKFICSDHWAAQLAAIA